MTVVQFPKRPVTRRRITHWCVVLWPYVLILLVFIVVATFTHTTHTCEPYQGC